MPPKLPDFANISERLRKALRLEHRIVVIGLSDTPPANLPHYELSLIHISEPTRPY